jgi:cell division protein FtsW
MDYSASFIFASERFGDGYYFLKRHLIFMALGLAAMLFFQNINYNKWRFLIFPLFLVSLAMLILTLVPGIGVKVGGARRWLRVGSLFRFQSSEVAKFALILFIANYYSKKEQFKDSFKTYIMVPVMISLIMVIPVLLQPDFSVTMLMITILISLMFIAGARIRYMLYLVIPVFLFVGTMISLKPYRMKRFLTFLHPWDDPANSGFQIIQSFMAFYSGGFWGVGLGDSRQKLLYLPEAHNDFIFAVIGEELGFVGVALTLFLFLILIYRGVRIALRAPDLFASLIVFGFVAMIAIQVIFNSGVVLGLLPVTGLTLPFISYGGASLVTLMAMVGVVLNISKYTTGEKK